MRRSIATVSLSGTLEEKLRAAAQAGFDGVEIFENDLVASPLPPREIRALASSLGLGVDLYQPFRDFGGVTEEQLAADLRRAEAKFALMVELGADTLLVCSNTAPDAIDDDALVTEQLYRLAEAARPYGVRIAYEALAWGTHVSTYGHTWDLVRRADHPGLGVCLDSFHVLSRGDDPAGIRDIPGEKIFFLQLADAPRLAMDVLQWSRHHRCFPGQGDFDLTAFTDHVLAAGYAGPLSLEVFNDVFRAADTGRTAADAHRSLALLEDAVVRQREESGDAVPEQLVRLPDPVPPRRFAFVEMAADTSATGEARAVLEALGFTHTRDHRSKPVELWEHGGTRILLNATDPRLGHTWDRAAAITAVGLDTELPDRALERAGTLSAPPLPRRRDPAETDLHAVAAPDGTAVFFCQDAGPGDQAWLDDFSAPAVHHPRDEAGPRLTGIDHIGLHQPFDQFDEAALFYRSVLGLSPSESTDLAAPDGLVRSRALVHRASGLRIALNVSVLGFGEHTRAAGGAQHIALGCEDVFAVAEAMREHGRPPLRVPDNYYADLAARTDLAPATVERMREHGVLYDRDPVTDAEFWHCYTPLLDGRLFFEVVQRGAGYEGFGARNTPVRMALHRAERDS
ncbi:bifunctional sugar phosphate isomerase/epimerase/4-hydroxyphenylpyruvate dioxygenase family protein [Nocardiopsis salina]|uniref:bifunctional sugar phosphate isomerase/epimerase/4-hydroxyphenylpyruvate dioxygenase family protein n=1 Tax=Nocardiopsis salina TaxID=245836 RepID=UPI0003491DB6|nr:sugar phosphate isomerase/epimerase and 4-hydroxyphenylpyruvate domain-containing protein [Nocardiopsis salina]